jgi:hypothetical protein
MIDREVVVFFPADARREQKVYTSVRDSVDCLGKRYKGEIH